MRQLLGTLGFFAFFFSNLAIAGNKNSVTYFKCTVNESYEENSQTLTAEVNVFFAVKDLNPYGGDNELIFYPGLDEEEAMGAILVLPEELPNGQWSKMTNLNGQGGDLRVDSESGNIRLFGDGAGYQFTDLVLWSDSDEKLDYRQGYVRDYGPTYGSEESFKQFINCELSNKAFTH